MRTCTLGFLAVSILVAGRAYGQLPFDYQAIDVPCDSGAPTFCPGGVAPQTAVNGINAWVHRCADSRRAITHECDTILDSD